MPGAEAVHHIRSDTLKKLSWDDLRIVKVIGEMRSLSAAASVLGVNNSTIFRKLTQIEEALAVTLFDRRRTGYLATPAGAEVITLAQRLELDIIGVTRRISGLGQDLAGDLRITTCDLFATHLAPIIAEFKAGHPAIRVEMNIGNAALNLARGEADIAVRATDAPPENLFGRKVATIAWAPYGRRIDFNGAGHCPDKLYQRDWVSYGGALRNLKAHRLIETYVPRRNIVFRIDSVAGVSASITAGLGLGYLPCMLGEFAPDLIRVGPVVPSLSEDLWVLTHPDIRKSARVCTFMKHCADKLAEQRPLIEGHRQRPVSNDREGAGLLPHSSQRCCPKTHSW